MPAAKHKHLRKVVLEYFLDHSAQECMKKFNLTKSEFKSLCTTAYCMPELAHLRKETRRHDPWSIEEILSLVKMAGILPRAEISRRLNRGSSEAVKHQLSRMSGSSRLMNGLPMSWAQVLLRPYDLSSLPKVRTPVGPGEFLIPWLDLYSFTRYKKLIGFEVRTCIKAMARFQGWIHGVKPRHSIANTLKEEIHDNDDAQKDRKHLRHKERGKDLRGVDE